MWIIGSYQPTSLFSLRPANATTSGGKTLLTPTPFAIKMALLDCAIRVYGKESAMTWFPQIRDLQLAIVLPRHLSVINTFVKILRPHKNGAKDVQGTGLVSPMGSTIAYREMVHFGGPLSIAFNEIEVENGGLNLAALMTQISYLGKRGGFMQLTQIKTAEELEQEFTQLNHPLSTEFMLNGTMQVLDDCGTKMSFDHADVYNNKNIGLNKPNGRLLRHIVLPYRIQRSSRGYTLYERIDS